MFPFLVVSRTMSPADGEWCYSPLAVLGLKAASIHITQSTRISYIKYTALS